jgi:hypothetical protein
VLLSPVYGAELGGTWKNVGFEFPEFRRVDPAEISRLTPPPPGDLLRNLFAATWAERQI